MKDATSPPSPVSMGLAVGLGALAFLVLRAGLMPTGIMPLVLAGLTTGLLIYFATQSNATQRRAVLLGWLVPGLGHLTIGERRRGLVLGAMIIATFLAGMILADFRNLSPFDRHPIWGLAHLFGGALAGIATLATQTLHIEHENPFYNVGCLYSGVATLLNILAMVDAWDLAGREEKTTPSDETSGTEEVAA